MNAKAVISRSFARIHETNLKKQGMLPLTFVDPSTYELIGPKDTISITGLASLAPDVQVACTINHEDGSQSAFMCNHTMSHEHIAWFRAGGALAVIRANAR